VGRGGTVFVVRSVIRERGNRAFAGLSVGFHVACAIAAAAALAWPYALYFVGLTGRAIALPAVERRAAGGPRPLRPIHVGIVEIVASTVLVILAFAVPFRAS
jgi:amino acid transporter